MTGSEQLLNKIARHFWFLDMPELNASGINVNDANHPNTLFRPSPRPDKAIRKYWQLKMAVFLENG
jgi:hypothetical protein